MPSSAVQPGLNSLPKNALRKIAQSLMLHSNAAQSIASLSMTSKKFAPLEHMGVFARVYKKYPVNLYERSIGPAYFLDKGLDTRLCTYMDPAARMFVFQDGGPGLQVFLCPAPRQWPLRPVAARTRTSMGMTVLEILRSLSDLDALISFLCPTAIQTEFVSYMLRTIKQKNRNLSLSVHQVRLLHERILASDATWSQPGRQLLFEVLKSRPDDLKLFTSTTLATVQAILSAEEMRRAFTHMLAVKRPEPINTSFFDFSISQTQAERAARLQASRVQFDRDLRHRSQNKEAQVRRSALATIAGLGKKDPSYRTVWKAEKLHQPVDPSIPMTHARLHYNQILKDSFAQAHSSNRGLPYQF